MDRAEVELDPRLRILPYKVRGVSRESQAQKAAHVLDTDLRTHWSSSTNAKEWLLLELEEPCLLSHIRIHNKSVLEWEIFSGLKYKPDTFAKIRSRCEAPRRDTQYHVAYVPCRFVRVSCLRGNPIAIFFIQLIGISIPGLEAEFQPVVDHLLPQIASHKQDSQDLHLQLLQDITLRLSPFVGNLEGDLLMTGEAMESSIRFLAMLAGPFYPILLVLRGRDNVKSAITGFDQEPAKNLQVSVFSVSSNFQAPPRRSRSPVPSQLPNGTALAFRPDVAILLLKVAYKEKYLGTVCRMVARVLQKLSGHIVSSEILVTGAEGGSGLENLGFSAEAAVHSSQTDYTPLFGEDFRVIDADGAELAGGVVDVAAVEEGLLHFLYACASQPPLCRKVADMKADLTPTLPFVEAMLPALRPVLSSSATTELVEEGFLQWGAPMIQRAVSQVVAVSISPAYRPLLDACAGYLSSYSSAHEKAACVLIDLCSGPLAPWLPMVVAKVDLAVELIEDLLCVIQKGHYATARARAALIYTILGLSGHMDDVLSKYKGVKHSIIFLVEMLEPFLTPAITPVKHTIAFGDVSTILSEKEKRTCALSLDLIRTAVEKPSVLPALEAEWRRGHVTPSVLLSILAPHIPLPPGIDLCQSTSGKSSEKEPSTSLCGTVDTNSMKLNGTAVKANSEDDGMGKSEQLSDGLNKADVNDDPSFLFAPVELHGISLQSFSSPFDGTSSENHSFLQFAGRADFKIGDSKDTPIRDPPVFAGLNHGDSKNIPTREPLTFDANCEEHYLNLQAEYLQLVNFQDREVKAAEFICFATELHSRTDMSLDSHNTAIDALLLAAECHLNPFFMIHSVDYEPLMNRIMASRYENHLIETVNPLSAKQKGEGSRGLQLVNCLENERDKAVLNIILKAAKWDWELVNSMSEENKLMEEGLSNGLERISSCICISDNDAGVEDAVTLVRRHQSLLYSFLVRQLCRERHNTYEALLHGLLFLLYSATQLSSPQNIVDVILRVVEKLNKTLLSLHNQMKEGNLVLGSTIIRSIRRQWILLERLVAAGSGSSPLDDDACFKNDDVHCRDLVPASAWMIKLGYFSCSPFPLVRYIGWKALSGFARSQEQTGLFLASDMHQLTSLLSIFSDELIALSVLERKHRSREESQFQPERKHGLEIAQVQLNGSTNDLYDRAEGGILSALYPELELLFPRLRYQFSQFADTLLDAICLQLRSMPSTSVSDILIWFSDMCCCPFTDMGFARKKNASSNDLRIKGFALANAKFIILRLLEAIVCEHMQAIMPELPRVLDVILSLCCSSYCDIQLLELVLTAMKPIISYTVSSATAVEYQLENESSIATFEGLCFDSLMSELKVDPNNKGISPKQGSSGALLLFLSGHLLSDLSAPRCNELMHLILRWVKFADHTSPSLYYNYLRAFEKIIEGSNLLVKAMLKHAVFSFSKENGFATESVKAFVEAVDSLENICMGKSYSDSYQRMIQDIQIKNVKSYVVTENVHNNLDTMNLIPHSYENTSQSEENAIKPEHTQGTLFRSRDEVENFLRSLQEVVSALGSSLEATWKIHPQLVEKIAFKVSHCLLISCLLSSNCANIDATKLGNFDIGSIDDPNMQGEHSFFNFQSAIESVAKMVINLQHDCCWQVAATMTDFLLSLPDYFIVSKVLPLICIALQYRSIHSPRVSWRLLTNTCVSKVVARVISEKFCITPAPLIQLLNGMLDHTEPEQRAAALQQLEKLSDLEEFCRKAQMFDLLEDQNLSVKWHVEELLNERDYDGGFATSVVSAAWSKVALLASSDVLISNRRHAMEVLLKFIPIVQQKQLDEFLVSVDVVLPLLTPSIYMMKNGPLIRLSLAILARACLYSSMSAIDAISVNVWSNLEIIVNSKPGSTLLEAEREICVALLQLREHGDDAKKGIEEILSRCHDIPEASPEFSHIRDSVLEVFARYNTFRLKEDAFRDAAAAEVMELEEAEIELELMREEQDVKSKDSLQSVQTRNVSSSPVVSTTNVKQRLQELKEQIVAQNQLAIRADVATRRERQRIARRDRQFALEEATLKELELLQELDRERAAELEHEIERQRILEKERAKTRELQHALEIDAEKRTQRELQRELEQRELGIIRSSRKEFPSSTQSRRYHPRGVRI